MKFEKSVIINVVFRKILPYLAEFVCDSLKEKDCKNWWKIYVINKLNENSKHNFPHNGSYEECINSLDIQACLNIIIINWRDIFLQKFEKNIFLTYTHLLKDIRNDIDAHYTIKILNSLNDENIERYLDAIIIFMKNIKKDIAEEIQLIKNEIKNEEYNISIRKNNKKVDDKNIKIEKKIINDEVNYLLTKIGKTFFVDYYNLLKDENISTGDIINLVNSDENRDYTEKSIRSRVSKSRKLIFNGLGIDALINIIDSVKIDEETKNKIDDLID